MARWSLINDIVSESMRANPLPETVEDLDAVTRRRVEAEALKQGITPSVLLAAIRAQQEAEAAGQTTTSAIVESVRRRQ